MPKKHPIISKEIFDAEIGICCEISKKKNGKCNWGECDKCGVIPLLMKFHTGVLVEDADEVAKLKKKMLK